MSGILTNSASGDSSMPMIKQGLRIISTRQKAAASEEFFEITAGGGSLLMGVSFPVKAVLKKNNEISITFEACLDTCSFFSQWLESCKNLLCMV